MTATIIDGKAIAKRVRQEVKAEVAELTAAGVQPGLATVLVGDDPASATYVRNKNKRATKLGFHSVHHHLPADTSQAALCDLVDTLNSDDAVDGILVQLPLPSQIDADPVLDRIDPAKDVDGLHPDNVGRLVAGAPRLVPCTPQGCVRLLDEAGAELKGARAVIVGRSMLVGKPLAHLLLARHCTVTLCHSRTRALDEEVARAEIVVAAAGSAGLVRGEWIRPGAYVIDVGTNHTEDGTLVGDVDFEGACARAAAITPVPGGVGPMTIAMLLVNTVRAARLRRGK
jgi:methylenetetrahydrofolate dehydrogenase (NADP+)/methenyltetrahydrofolate cyclohydrolase